MVFNKAKLTTGLTLAANILANEMRRVTTSERYPSEIPASIKVDPAVVDDTGGRITISSIANDAKGEAVDILRAYELGSGKFGPRGTPYVIEGNPLLAFPVGKWDAYMEPPPKPKVSFVFPKVMHPGIRPRSFIINSVHAVDDRMMEVLDQNFTLEIFDGPKVEYIR